MMMEKMKKGQKKRKKINPLFFSFAAFENQTFLIFLAFHIYIYIYLYICLNVCVCVCIQAAALAEKCKKRKKKLYYPVVCSDAASAWTGIMAVMRFSSSAGPGGRVPISCFDGAVCVRGAHSPFHSPQGRGCRMGGWRGGWKKNKTETTITQKKKPSAKFPSLKSSSFTTRGRSMILRLHCVCVYLWKWLPVTCKQIRLAADGH